MGGNHSKGGTSVVIEGTDRYAMGKVLGRGQFGAVFQAHDKLNNIQVAIKVIEQPKDEDCEKYLECEKAVMKLNHPNIIRLLDVYETKAHVYLVMTYCPGGSLENYLNTHGVLPESLARKFLGDMVKGLLGMKDFLHRDLKPANLLLDDDKSPVPNIKLGDFGLSRVLDPADMAASWVGTPNHMAPEVMDGKEYNHQADMWSLGVIYYQMLTGGMPFDDSNYSKLNRAIRKGIVRISPEDISDEAWYIIMRLLVRDPSKRMTIEELTAILFYPTPPTTPSLPDYEQQLSPCSSTALAWHKPYYELVAVASYSSDQDLLLSVSLYIYVLQSGKKFLTIKEHEKQQKKDSQACSLFAKKLLLLVMNMALDQLQNLLRARMRALQQCSVPVGYSIFCRNGLLLTEVEQETNSLKRKEKVDRALFALQAYQEILGFIEKDKQISAEMEGIISDLKSGYI